MKKLNILIPTIEGREDLLKRLINSLRIQLIQNNLLNHVDIVTAFDKGEKTIGEKRNDLLRNCNSEYCTFFDDDDMPTSNYIEYIFNIFKNNNNVDAIGITNLIINKDNTKNLIFHKQTDKSYTDENNNYVTYLNHTSIIKTEIAKTELFEESSYNEYKDWCININKKLKTIIDIPEPLYIFLYRITDQYNYDTKTVLCKYTLLNNKLENLYNTILESTKKSIWYFITFNKESVLDAFKEADLYLLYKWITIIKSDDLGYVNDVNSYLSNLDIDWTYLILLDNTKIPKINCWDRLIKENMENQYPDDDGVLFFNDNINKSELNTYPILTKKYYNKFNYCLYPDYYNLYANNEFTLVANALTKQTYFSTILFEQEDIQNSVMLSDDMTLYKKRKQKNFGLDIKYKIDRKPRLKGVKTKSVQDKISDLIITPNSNFIIKNTSRDRIIYESKNSQPIILEDDRCMIGNLYFNYTILEIIEL